VGREVAPSPENVVVYRGLDHAPPALESDFESYAFSKRKGKRGSDLEAVLMWYGVSVFDSVDALLAKRRCVWIAEMQVEPSSGVLALKTGLDPNHHDLLGDREDMIEIVLRYIEPPA
jgi:hypothetical protein